MSRRRPKQRSVLFFAENEERGFQLRAAMQLRDRCRICVCRDIKLLRPRVEVGDWDVVVLEGCSVLQAERVFERMNTRAQLLLVTPRGNRRRLPAENSRLQVVFASLVWMRLAMVAFDEMLSGLRAIKQYERVSRVRAEQPYAEARAA